MLQQAGKWTHTYNRRGSTYQDALVHVAVVLAVEVQAHPNDAGVGRLLVVHGQGSHGHGAFVVVGGQGTLRLSIASGQRGCRARICLGVRDGAGHQRSVWGGVGSGGAGREGRSQSGTGGRGGGRAGAGGAGEALVHDAGAVKRLQRKWNNNEIETFFLCIAKATHQSLKYWLNLENQVKRLKTKKRMASMAVLALTK